MDAKLLRTKLKEIGYNKNHVSVKEDFHGCSSSITLTIRDIKVDYEKVNALSVASESVDRDKATGEILMGGNTFIDVVVAPRLRDQISELYKKPLVSILDIVDNNLSDNLYICESFTSLVDVRKLNDWLFSLRIKGTHVAKVGTGALSTISFELWKRKVIVK